jgi:hypothetical protein
MQRYGAVVILSDRFSDSFPVSRERSHALDWIQSLAIVPPGMEDGEVDHG